MYWLTWIMVLASHLCNGTSCTWDEKTVRVLVLLDDYDQNIETEFRTSTSVESLNALYNEPGACVPDIKFNFLTFNRSSSEINTIQETYRRFSQYSFCTIILASNHRHAWYALEYAKLKHIPVINIMSKVIFQFR
jgi:hypothetical protein